MEELLREEVVPWLQSLGVCRGGVGLRVLLCRRLEPAQRPLSRGFRLCFRVRGDESLPLAAAPAPTCLPRLRCTL